MSAEAAYLPLFIFLIVTLVFFYLFRAFLKFNREKKKTEQKDTSHVGFVVDTFHELVSKLKEKEKELEVLKKLAEQRAGDVESYNRNILQSVPSGVISFDRDLRINTMNSSAEKILGIKAEDAIERNCEELFKNPVAKLLKEGKPIERGEVQYKLPDGRELWLGLTFSPLRDNAGKEIGNILVFTDLTELKALESQAELRKRLSSLGEMSAGIAHELRNPLGVIAGYTKLLSRKADAALLPTVEAISKEIEVMDRIISDFLSFARPVELTLSKINLNEVINSCVSSIAGVSGPDIIGEVLLDIDKSVFISGDEILLRQAFTNLIQNAADAMKDGGKLSFGYAKTGGYAEITVSDTGHGIPEGIKDKIFLPFYTTKEKGTGLGLAIVHKIITSHAGTIHVDSTGSGTTFRLRLPSN
ncbi:MAG: ATP-binding protein [Thermodesulfovibrionales bacterium]|nr:ATP-binding protein [Thermodesulfovibrionales bacterium]